MSDLFDEWEAYCKDGSDISFKNFAEAKVTELEAEVSALKDYKIYGVAYQHEDTGVQGVVDIWQVEQGFFDNNPRLHEIGTVVLLPPSDGVEI